MEDARLRGLDEEQRLALDPRGHGDGKHALEDPLGDLLAAAAQAYFDLRLALQRERLRGARILEGEILDVDTLDGQRRTGGSLRLGHANFLFGGRNMKL